MLTHQRKLNCAPYSPPHYAPPFLHPCWFHHSLISTGGPPWHKAEAIRVLGFELLAQPQWATPPPPPAGYWISCLLSCYEVLPQRRFAKDWQTLLWGVAFAGVSSGLFSLRLFSGDWRTATLGETCRQLLHSAPDGVWRTPCSCAQIFEDDLVGDQWCLTLWYLSQMR